MNVSRLLKVMMIMMLTILYDIDHLFGVPGCGHCVEAKPAFSKLATALKEEKSTVKAVAVEAADNPKVADFAGIQTLPTFKLFANGKLVADYDGGRTLEEMHQFCKSHAKVKDEL